MFKDQTTIYLKAGKGGNGAVSFLREKYRPKGGPDGGDGGNGGDIIIKTDRNIVSLTAIDRQRKFSAENGLGGMSDRKKGRDGEDLVIKVPMGTMIREKGKTIFDLSQEGQQEVICRGGQGGWGNWHFKSSIKQAPTWSKSGLLGEEREVDLELKLIADVGLVGLPNAGKSTLLSVISNARPKIAEYPFTTLSPNLGVVRFGRRELVFADIPGLIDGASSGRGLGDQFLRHIERTKILIHLISSEEADFLEAYRIIRCELEKFNKNLLKKPEIIVISKSDLLDHKNLKVKIKKISQKNKNLLVISSASHQGLDKLKEKVFSNY